jgi:hypothetical protein
MFIEHNTEKYTFSINIYNKNTGNRKNKKITRDIVKACTTKNKEANISNLTLLRQRDQIPSHPTGM